MLGWPPTAFDRHHGVGLDVIDGSREVLAAMVSDVFHDGFWITVARPNGRAFVKLARSTSIMRVSHRISPFGG